MLLHNNNLVIQRVSIAHMDVVQMQKEASEVFFSVTKLFQNKDANLRRMVYLVIKDVCPSADEVIIITSSLMKDMNSKTDLYRSNAIRVLCSITDTQLLAQIERSVPAVPLTFAACGTLYLHFTLQAHLLTVMHRVKYAIPPNQEVCMHLILRHLRLVQVPKAGSCRSICSGSQRSACECFPPPVTEH